MKVYFKHNFNFSAKKLPKFCSLNGAGAMIQVPYDSKDAYNGERWVPFITFSPLFVL